MTRVAALIPAYNEAKMVGETVRAVRTIPEISEIIVIDDGSTDGTLDAALEAGARVIRVERNTGKGEALNRGLAETQADIVLMADADLGSCAAHLRALIDSVVAGQADMAIASMSTPERQKGGFGFATRLSRWAIKKYGGAAMKTPLSGQRAIRRRVLEDVGSLEERFGVETALTIDTLRKGYRVVEIDLPLRHRETGRNLRGFLHRGKQFIDILRAVWKRRR